MKDLKESNPVQVSEYAITNKIAGKTAFSWWVRHVFRRRDRIMNKLKSRYWRKPHKFGIELPKSVKASMDIDHNTRTDLCCLSIEKEMKNVMPAFEFRDNDKMPIGYKKIGCHMIFDVNMDYIPRKLTGSSLSSPY